MKHTSAVKILFINFMIFTTCMVILETVWRVIYSDDIHFSVNVLTDTQYQYDVSMLYPSENNIIAYSRDKYGFRGKYRRLKDIDIIAVGGSTTDQRYIDNTKEWTYVLANAPVIKELDITIVNAGVDGQSTYGHIKNFDLWFSKIDSLKPRYILFYVGVNDFYNDFGYLYDSPNLKDSLTWRTIVKGSFVYYTYRLIKGMILTKAYGLGHEMHDIKSIQTTSIPLLEEKEYRPLMKTRLDAYLKRLDILQTKTRELGAIPVFITQRRMNHWKKNNQIIGINEEYSYGNIKYNGVDMHYMEKLLNKVTMSICKDRNDIICIDLALELTFTRDDFYDFFHNTPSGAAKIGGYLSKKIKSFY